MLPDDIPISIDPIIGWRAWRVHSQRRQLQSLHSKEMWPYREACRATCDPPYALRGPFGGWAPPHKIEEHESPCESCHCGVYASLDEQAAINGAGYHHGSCIGQVALWGKVCVGEKGWRAEFAYPVELWLLDSTVLWSDQILAFLEDAYGVPVHRRRYPPAERILAA